ncbi:hypothetical protein C8F04DRAFT_1137569 [Mycena alexandri]|uniref:RRM domain-containing protein n=1 Tax=Mycena alexandri TaxID=1745969 RepID=A0AAD6S910_9AGAR|nr:hypothetical protein C8F04DRAFT_1137569 [Mycena alexandri]
MAESSSTPAPSKKADKKSKRKDADSAAVVEPSPSPSKNLKRKKSADVVDDAPAKNEGEKSGKRKKAKKDAEVAVEAAAPVEDGKKKKSAKATETLADEPANPDEGAPTAKKPRRSKGRASGAAAAVEPAPAPALVADAESSAAPAEKPAKKAKKSKLAVPEPEPTGIIEDALKPAKKSKKSKAEAPEPAAPVDEPMEVTKPPKKAKKSKAEPAAVPAPDEPIVMETEVAKPPKKSKKSKAEAAVTEQAPAADEPMETETEVAKPLKKSKKATAEAPLAPEPEPTPLTAVEPATVSPKKSKKSKSAATEPEPAPAPALEPELDLIPVDHDGDDSSDEDYEDEAPLHGFSTDDDDSSDDEGYMDVEVSAFDVAKLPTIAKDDATVKRKLENAKRQPTADRGVLFLGRIPHGFYEDQLKAYFSQFGNITRLRVSRNKKTGQSKHYGFIEFDSSSVAQIVADTMDNYLLMGHIMRCKVIPKAEVHPELWVGANRTWRPVPKVRLAQAEYNKLRTPDEQVRAAKRLLKRQEERQRKLEKQGISYDFGAVGYKPLPKAIET